MSFLEDEKIDKISHHIESISKEMYQVKKAILEEKKMKEKLSIKDKRRQESLKKAQKKFRNISTNFKIGEFEKIQERIKTLNKSASAYIKELVSLDLEKQILG